MRYSWVIEEEIESNQAWLVSDEFDVDLEKDIRHDIQVLEEELADALDYEDEMWPIWHKEDWDAEGYRRRKLEECA